jgi:peptidoglycan/LPS O-acetylase OafA/YrhL
MLRVVAVHLLGIAPMALLWWPAPTFVAPGMPLVFFVAGALALKSLDPYRPRHSSAKAFWRDRFRRLLIPFWAYLAVALTVTIWLDVTNAGGQYSVDYGRAALSAVPLLNPLTSPVGYLGMVHLWFLVAISWLLLAAPGLVWLHRRFPKTLLASVVVVGLSIPLLGIHTPLNFFPEITSIALFMFFFVLGFWYTDGLLVKDVVPGRRAGVFDGWTGVFIAVLAFAGAWFVWQVHDPGSINNSHLVHGLLGLGWLALILLARPWILRLANAMPNLLNTLNSRALTMYLWGWPTTALSAEAVRAWGLSGVIGTVVFFALAIGSLTLAVMIFGRVEDYAAGRGKRGRGSQRDERRDTDPAQPETVESSDPGRRVAVESSDPDRRVAVESSA